MSAWRDRMFAARTARACEIAQLIAGGAQLQIDDTGRVAAVLDGTVRPVSWDDLTRALRRGLVWGPSFSRLQITEAGHAALDDGGGP